MTRILLALADILQMHRVLGEDGPFAFFDVNPKLPRVRIWIPGIERIYLVEEDGPFKKFPIKARIVHTNGAKETTWVSNKFIENIQSRDIQIIEGRKYAGKLGSGAT